MSNGEDFWSSFKDAIIGRIGGAFFLPFLIGAFFYNYEIILAVLSSMEYTAKVAAIKSVLDRPMHGATTIKYGISAALIYVLVFSNLNGLASTLISLTQVIFSNLQKIALNRSLITKEEKETIFAIHHKEVNQLAEVINDKTNTIERMQKSASFQLTSMQQRTLRIAKVWVNEHIRTRVELDDEMVKIPFFHGKEHLKIFSDIGMPKPYARIVSHIITRGATSTNEIIRLFPELDNDTELGHTGLLRWQVAVDLLISTGIISETVGLANTATLMPSDHDYCEAIKRALDERN